MGSEVWRIGSNHCNRQESYGTVSYSKVIISTFSEWSMKMVTSGVDWVRKKRFRHAVVQWRWDWKRVSMWNRFRWALYPMNEKNSFPLLSHIRIVRMANCSPQRPNLTNRHGSLMRHAAVLQWNMATAPYNRRWCLSSHAVLSNILVIAEMAGSASGRPSTTTHSCSNHVSCKVTQCNWFLFCEATEELSGLKPGQGHSHQSLSYVDRREIRVNSSSNMQRKREPGNPRLTQFCCSAQHSESSACLARHSLAWQLDT